MKPVYEDKDKWMFSLMHRYPYRESRKMIRCEVCSNENNKISTAFYLNTTTEIGQPPTASLTWSEVWALYHTMRSTMVEE